MGQEVAPSVEELKRHWERAEGEPETDQQMATTETHRRAPPLPGTLQTYKSITIKVDYEKDMLDS